MKAVLFLPVAVAGLIRVVQPLRSPAFFALILRIQVLFWLITQNKTALMSCSHRVAKFDCLFPKVYLQHTRAERRYPCRRGAAKYPIQVQKCLEATNRAQNLSSLTSIMTKPRALIQLYLHIILSIYASTVVFVGRTAPLIGIQ